MDGSEETLFNENLFQLLPVIINIDIKLCSRMENGLKQFLGIVTKSNELVLYYTLGRLKSIIQKVPWFDDKSKTIKNITFDPSATWLLALTVDNFLYIVPALKLVDPSEKIDCKWPVDKLTSFQLANKIPETNPTCITWWQTLECNQNAIIGYDNGDVQFISLTDGSLISTSSVTGSIQSIEIYQDNSLESVFLFITTTNNNQWRLLLEHRSARYNWLEEIQQRTIQENANLNKPESSDSKHMTYFKELKQMSVDKLTTFKQKLSETKTKSINLLRKSSSGSIDKMESRVPVKISHSEQPVIYQPQFIKNRSLIVGHMKQSALVFIQEIDFESVPLYIHKILDNCDEIIASDQFFYVVNDDRKHVSVISCTLSETKLKDDSEFNDDALFATFKLPKSEESIISVYKLSSVTCINEPIERRTGHADRLFNNTNDSSVDLSEPKLDACIVVTTKSVYAITLRTSVIQSFVNLVCRKDCLPVAEKLCMAFCLNIQQLLEFAGDTMLTENECIKAVKLYRQSKCQLIKIVLKFAMASNSRELLRLIEVYLNAQAVEISYPTKIHLSNLALMAHTELHLRSTTTNRDEQTRRFNAFVEFLSKSDTFDEILAIEMLCQLSLWDWTHMLLTYRGLSHDVIESICRIIKQSYRNKPPEAPRCKELYDRHLYECLASGQVLQCLLLDPNSSRTYCCFIRATLDLLPVPILHKLCENLDPSRPTARPIIAKLSETINQSEHGSSTQALRGLIGTFLQVLAYTLAMNKTTFDQQLMTLSVHVATIQKPAILFKKYRHMSAGYAHVAISRNNSIWSWGYAAYGCLGHGPVLKRFDGPKEVLLLDRLNLEVVGVSCGRTHTLLLTNYGVYAWGSNVYGQLGLGPELLRTPYPVMIEAFKDKMIVDVCAGQYHSLALTAHGEVYSWGWNVHGQLGLGHINDVNTPTKINVKDAVIAQISAGHAHSLLLSSKGIVYSFGSNYFGELGNGTTTKHSRPRHVTLLPEKIVFINTHYFQNFAISTQNNLYTWGASPQVLRTTAQAQKRQRLRVINEKYVERKSEREKMKVCDDNGQMTEMMEISKQDEEAKENGDENVESRDSDIKDGKVLEDILEEVNDENPETKPNSPNVAKDSEIDQNDSKMNNYESSENQDTSHLYPQLVDTRLVDDIIVSVSSGFHHAALLTKEGCLYTWGKNLTGQLGTGNRIECHIPTRIELQPLVRRNASDVRFMSVACGAEFTVVIDTNGKVMAWGNNTFGQLGRPSEETNAPDGKMFTIKTTKRVIKFPNVSHHIHERPLEVQGIPTPNISFFARDKKSFVDFTAPIFRSIRDDNAEFTSDSLHRAIETYFGMYDSEKLIDACVKYGDFQAVSKIALLERYFMKSLEFQLKSLERFVDDNVFNGKINVKNQILDRNLNGCERNECERNKKIEMIQSNLLAYIELINCYKNGNDLDKLDMAAEFPVDDDANASKMNMMQMMHNAWRKRNAWNQNGAKANENGNSSNSSKKSDGKNEPIKSNKTKSSNKSTITARKREYFQQHSRFEVEISDKTADILMFYIDKAETMENHILMQNILIASINFWLCNGLNVAVLEDILLKNMSKYLYPLSVILFCKNFYHDLSADEENDNCKSDDTNLDSWNQSHEFLKQFSSKFCLNLCHQVLDRVNKNKTVQVT